MTLEKGSFTPTQSLETLTLNNTALNPDRFVFWCDGTYKSHGYDDGTDACAAYGASTLTNATRSVYVHNGTTLLQSAKVTAKSVGEFDMTFDVYNGERVHFLAIED